MVPFPNLCKAYEYAAEAHPRWHEKALLKLVWRYVLEGELPVCGLPFLVTWKRLSGGKIYRDENLEPLSFGRVPIKPEKMRGHRLELIREPRPEHLSPWAKLSLPPPKIIDCKIVMGGDFDYWEARGVLDHYPCIESGWRDVRTEASAVETLLARETEPSMAPEQIEPPRLALELPPRRKVGRIAVVGPRVEREMMAAIQSGELTRDGLWGTDEKSMVTRFKASRNICRRARDAVLNCPELISGNSSAKDI
jgi:hypothetical protein